MVVGQAFEQIATGILRFVNYGITILVIMLIWEGLRFIGKLMGKGGALDRGADAAVKGAIGLKDWKRSPVVQHFKGKKKAKIVRRKAKRERSRILNEYVAEKAELKKIKEAKQKLVDFEAATSAAKAGQDAKPYKKKYGELVDAVKEAVKQERKDKRKKRREGRVAKKLIEELEDIGIADKDIKSLEMKEKNVRKQHEILDNNFDEVHNLLKELKSKVEKEVIYQNKFRGATKLSGGITAVKAITPQLNKKLGAALAAEEQANADIQGLVAQFEPIWDAKLPASEAEKEKIKI